MQVGTHGWNHVPWTGLDDAAFAQETSQAATVSPNRSAGR